MDTQFTRPTLGSGHQCHCKVFRTSNPPGALISYEDTAFFWNNLLKDLPEDLPDGVSFVLQIYSWWLVIFFNSSHIFLQANNTF